MIHTDEENLRWWNGLSRFEREALLDRMLEKGNSMEFRAMVKGFQGLVQMDRPLSGKQIAQVRKWS